MRPTETADELVLGVVHAMARYMHAPLTGEDEAKLPPGVFPGMCLILGPCTLQRVLASAGRRIVTRLT